MEKKKTQRIIGILVLIAFVIMIAPLLLGKNNGPVAEATDIKAPPFPDQPKKPVLADATPTEVTAAPAAVPTATISTAPIAPVAAASTSPTATTSPAPTVPAATTDATTTPTTGGVISPPADKAAASDQLSSNNLNSSEPKPDSILPEKTNANETAPTIIYEHPKETNDVKKEIVAPTIKPQAHSTNKIKPAVVTEKVRKVKNVKSVMAKNKYAAATDQANKLKAAWAIQMGSFKVKQNAINFVNKLRASGYKAFTRDVKTANGDKVTGVYIGPEFKQASALKLAFDVNHHFNMKGYVIAYQPFEI